MAKHMIGRMLQMKSQAQTRMKPYRVTLHKAEQLEFKENKHPCTEIHHKYI